MAASFSVSFLNEATVNSVLLYLQYSSLRTKLYTNRLQIAALHMEQCKVVCRVWEPNTAGTSMFMMIKIFTHKSVKGKHDGIRGWCIYDLLNGWGIYDLNGWGIYGLKGWGIYDLNGWGIYGLKGWGIYDKWVGHLGLNGWGSYGKVSCRFLGDMLKNTGLQGSTLSGLRMTTGFGPFELPNCGLLQKGRDHSPPKFCFVRSPASWLAQLLLWAFTML